jgi:hypothetical protein
MAFVVGKWYVQPRIGHVLILVVKWLKVSSVSRLEKLERVREAGTAKLMKPHHELNLNGKFGL